MAVDLPPVGREDAVVVRVGVGWEDAGSIDPRHYTELECFVAGALSTMAPFDTEYSPRTLPFARRALEALSEWEPTDG